MQVWRDECNQNRNTEAIVFCTVPFFFSLWIVVAFCTEVEIGDYKRKENTMFIKLCAEIEAK